MRRGLAAAVFTLALLLAAGLAGSADAALRLAGVASGFTLPVHVASSPGAPGEVYVVEQGGLVKVVDGGRVRATPFLDIRDLVSCCGEQGLLSLAFHPRYPTNPRVYVNYTNRAGDTRIVEYRVSSDRSRVVERTARRLVAIDQPYSNHNGGQIAFGRDGYLYAAMGDGGSGGDPGNLAQNMRTRLGKLLRINVRTRAAGLVALGFRNPWRFSVDRRTGILWIGDVGQSSREEISIYRPGARGLENYGWRRFEGTFTHSAGTRLYARSRYVRPVHEYGRDGGACAVTGGFVYRGAIRSLRGRYFFGDYCHGRVSSFVLQNGRRAGLMNHPGLTVAGGLSSFGEGPTGELYLVSHGNGRIFRIAAG